MDGIRERAERASNDTTAMMNIADEIRHATQSTPAQISAANAVRRSILMVQQGTTEMRLEVLKARYAKLLLTL
jgi:hypothetical protein